jgi:hypothetical protein
VEVALLRGNGPLDPISRRRLGRRLTRHSQWDSILPLPEIRFTVLRVIGWQ